MVIGEYQYFLLLIHTVNNSSTYICVAFSIIIYVQVLFIALCMMNGRVSYLLLCLEGCILWPIKLFWMKIMWCDFIRNSLCGVINIVQSEWRYGLSCFHFIVFSTSRLQHVLEEREKKKNTFSPSPFLSYNQQDAIFLDLFISNRCSACFRRSLRPSSGSQNCTHSCRYCHPILLLAASMDEMVLSHLH